MSEFASVEEILGSEDRAYVDVEVPEWGGKVRLMEMTGDDADAFSTFSRNNAGDLSGVRARLVGLCLVNESGKRLFSDDAIERKLGKKSGKVLGRLFQEAAELNGMTPEAREEMKENFSEATEDSTTD